MYDRSISDPDPSSIKSVVNQSLSHPSAVNVHKEASLFTMIAKLLWKYVGYQSGRWLHLIKKDASIGESWCPVLQSPKHLSRPGKSPDLADLKGSFVGMKSTRRAH